MASDDDLNEGGGPLGGLAFWGVIGLVLVLLLAVNSTPLWGGKVKRLSYSELVHALENGQIKKLTIEKKNGAIEGEFETSGVEKPEYQKFSSNVHTELFESFTRRLDVTEVPYTFQDPNPLVEYLPHILPLLIVFGLLYFLVFRQMRNGGGGGILSFGKSRAVRITRDKSNKTFDDVAGIDEAREEVKEIIEFLKNPEKFQRLGGRLPKGVLLIGSPGTGKTLLARAIAGEADVPFFSISGSDFVEMFVGVGASRVRDLFEQAKGASPCIIFLDEIDAVGRKRANELPGSGIESAQTLNAILVEMDGFTSDDSVIVIAATNRPDVLDPALLRPGRFDRRIYVDLPDIRGREEILKVHCKEVIVDKDVDLTIIARGTPLFSGADLENLVNEAALLAVMKELDAVTIDCFEEARDKVRFGKEKRSRVMDDADRRATAVHEAGHALLRRLVPNVTPLHKITIIPRGRALGATMHLPEKDEYTMSRRRIHGEIAVLMGGHAAEETVLEDVSNGAAMDFEMATSYARRMICEWGMSDTLGHVSYPQPDEEAMPFAGPRSYSEATAQKIDEEVHAILEERYATAKQVLTAHRDELDLLVEALMEFESLNRDEVDQLYADGGLDEIRAARGRKKNNNGTPKVNDEATEAASEEPKGDPAATEVLFATVAETPTAPAGEKSDRPEAAGDPEASALDHAAPESPEDPNS